MGMESRARAFRTHTRTRTSKTLRLPGLFLGYRDIHRKSTPLVRFALDLDAAVVGFDDAFDDGQSQAGDDLNEAALICGIISLSA